MGGGEPFPAVPAPGDGHRPDAGGPGLHDVPRRIADVEGSLRRDAVLRKGVIDLLLLAEEEIGAEDLLEIGIEAEAFEHPADGPGSIGGDDREEMVLLKGIEYGDQAVEGFHGIVVESRKDLLRRLGEGGKVHPPGRHRFVEITIEKRQVILPGLQDRRPDPLHAAPHRLCVEVQRIREDAVKVEQKQLPVFHSAISRPSYARSIRSGEEGAWLFR